MSKPIATATDIKTTTDTTDKSKPAAAATDAPKASFLSRIRELGAKVGQWFKDNAQVILLSALAVAAVVTAAVIFPVIIAPLVLVTVVAASVYGIWALASFVMNRFFKANAKEDASTTANNQADKSTDSTNAINSKLAKNPGQEAANDDGAKVAPAPEVKKDEVKPAAVTAEAVGSIGMRC